MVAPPALRRPRAARLCTTSGGDGGEEELNPETVSYLVDRTSAREVFLVGTAHVSERSAEDVRQTIRIAKPHGLMVELCDQRAQRIREGKGPRTPKEVAEQLLSDLKRNGRPPPGFSMEFLLQVGFASFYALMRQYGLIPGVEFELALKEAERLNLPICMGDQQVDRTMSELRSALSSISLSTFMNAPPPPPELAAAASNTGMPNLKVRIEEMKNRKQIAALRDYVTRLAPDIMDVMVARRNHIMTEALLTRCPAGRTVAVVGMAHMDGIEEEWRSRGGEVFLHADNSLRN